MTDMKWFVYMLRCERNRIYTGIAVDVDSRFASHMEGKGAAFTKAFKPIEILAKVEVMGRSEASKLEYKIKQMDRKHKIEFAKRYKYIDGA